MNSSKVLLRTIKILMLLAAAGALISGLVLAGEQKAYRQGEAAYGQIRSLGAPAAETGPGEGAGIQSRGAADLKALKRVNPDATGWIYAPGTRIDYPIVKGQDNTFYLKHMFDRTLNKVGAIFMDWRSSGDFSDRNTILYGHNMKDGSMFAALSSYKDQTGYEKAPQMILDTAAGRFFIDLFAGNIVHGATEEVPLAFDSEDEFRRYIDKVKENSTFSSDVTVSSGDRIVTLATCTYEFDDARYIFFGKISPFRAESKGGE